MQRAGGEAVASTEVFGTARTYAELLAIFRQRIASLGVTLESCDHVAGNPLRYTQKILSGVRGFGRCSLEPLLVVLGAKIIVCADERADERIKARLILRKSAGAGLLAGRKHKQRRISGPEASAYFKVLRARQLLKQSKRKRRLVARIAARARWQNGGGRHSEAPSVR
jgi:hypothetical protein